jgi:uncharacterized protein YoxC
MSTELIALVVLIILMFFIMTLKDGDTTKKLSRYERSIDELGRQNHRLRKEIIELGKHSNNFLKDVDNIVEEKVKEQIQHSIYPLIESMREIENVMQSFQEEQIQRIDRMEEKSQDISYLPLSTTASNEKLIIAQYGSGKSEAMIAKNLRIGIGEVDLVLKLANLK